MMWVVFAGLLALLALIEVAGFFVRRWARRVETQAARARADFHFWRTIYHGWR